MRYEDFVRKVCGDEWKNISDEKTGGFGVACVKAFLGGAKPSLGDMAANLGITTDELYPAFSRLARAGAFRSSQSPVFGAWNIRRDKALANDDRRAWAHVAAVASGFIGV